MRRETAFQNFKATIDTGNRTGALSYDSRLILRGRIDYAVERGDLSAYQADDLFEMIGRDFGRTTEQASEVASLGEGDLTPVSLVNA